MSLSGNMELAGADPSLLPLKGLGLICSVPASSNSLVRCLSFFSAVLLEFLAWIWSTAQQGLLVTSPPDWGLQYNKFSRAW